MITRRKFLTTGAALAGGSAFCPRAQAARERELRPAARSDRPPRQQANQVVTPNGAGLAWKMVEGIKVYHLTAEPVRHEFAPGLAGECWGYNGRVHGPTLEAVEGDRVRVYVTNKLSAATTVHWHGIHLPNGMDRGVGSPYRLPALLAQAHEIRAIATNSMV